MVSRLASWVVVILAAASAVPPAGAQTRQYAPGVLTVVPPDAQYADTVSGPMQMVEISVGMPETDWDPNYGAKSQTVFGKSQQMELRREVWCFEFAFKPVRTIYVDVPQASGKMQRKLVWYLVYRVRYLGGDVAPTSEKDRWGRMMFKGSPVAREGRYFFPQFVLESHEFGKSYQDRILPAAQKLIERHEMRGDKLLNSVEISRQPIPISTPEMSHETWGLATWEDVDPQIDYFSVFVRGLTNAYKPVDVPDGFQKGADPGTGRDLLAKTLQLNFWRPGDAVQELEDRITFGLPYASDSDRQQEILSAYGLKKRLDYLWVYR